MKKVLSFTIALCLVFASVLPVYAEAWTSEQAYQTNQGVVSLVSLVTNIYSLLQTNFGASGDIALMGENIAKLVSWLAPDGYKPSDYHSLWEICLDMGTALYQYLPYIPNIANYVSSWMGQNNNYLNSLREGLTNNWSSYSYNTTQDRWSKMAHYLLYPKDSTSAQFGWYEMTMIGSDGVAYQQGIPWNGGTPLGNIALINKWSNENAIRMHQDFRNIAFTDYTGQLGIWDSQGDTLTQEGWSPTSAINGLYKYLAYTQRDVARLTYVLASDEEIETREKAKATQTAVMDDFVDPDGVGAASVDDFGSISDASSGVQSNFNTGVSAGGVWNVFERNYEWFSQETANNLSYQPQRSKKSLKAAPDQEYETPYLDSYYDELHDIIGF